MFSTVNHFETCKPGRVNLTVVLNTDYCQTFKILHHLNEVYNILILKETLDAKYLRLHIQMHLSKLECLGKVHLFQ